MPRLAVEPGRAIAGPGTVTLYEIGTIKPVRLGASGAPGTPLVRNYVSVDGGMSDNIRTALYDASYTCVLANRDLRRAAGAVPRRRQALRERRHPGARPAGCPRTSQPGDLLAVAATGAYCWSMASNYNYLLKPPVVAVRDGAATEIVRRQTLSDVFALDAVLADLPAPPRPRRSRLPSTRWGRGRERAAEGRAARLRHRRQRRPAADRGAGRRPHRPHRPRRSRSRASPSAARRTTPTCPRTCSPPTPRPWSAGDDVDLVVEVIGGIEPARTLMLTAFEAGKSVVSANKALLAEDGVELHAAAAKAGVDLYYEAAVAGAIPLLRPLRESLAGDRIRRVMGIVNGTTNYILSRMAETGAGFAEALAEATELGLRRGRPDRRRRRLRRRGEGRDPRLARVPHARSPPPTSTARASRRCRRPTSPGPPRSAARSSCWPSASG